MHWIDISEKQDGSELVNLALARGVTRVRPDVAWIWFGDADPDGSVQVNGEAAVAHLRFEVGILAKRAALERANLHAQNRRDAGWCPGTARQREDHDGAD